MSGFKVIIVGAGLAGSLLANGLMNNDIDFVVYESDPEGCQREGYQIRLGAPAIIGFKSCLQTDQLEKLYPLFGRSGGVVSSAPVLYDQNFTQLLDLTKFPAYTKSAPINRVILRDFLANPIAAAGKLHYGKKFTRFDSIQTDSGNKIIVQFDDGTQDECDLLVSAEGSRSKVSNSRHLVRINSRHSILTTLKEQ